MDSDWSSAIACIPLVIIFGRCHSIWGTLLPFYSPNVASGLVNCYVHTCLHRRMGQSERYVHGCVVLFVSLLIHRFTTQPSINSLFFVASDPHKSLSSPKKTNLTTFSCLLFYVHPISLTAFTYVYNYMVIMCTWSFWECAVVAVIDHVLNITVSIVWKSACDCQSATGCTTTVWWGGL